MPKSKRERMLTALVHCIDAAPEAKQAELAAAFDDYTQTYKQPPLDTLAGWLLAAIEDGIASYQMSLELAHQEYMDAHH